MPPRRIAAWRTGRLQGETEFANAAMGTQAGVEMKQDSPAAQGNPFAESLEGVETVDCLGENPVTKFGPAPAYRKTGLSAEADMTE